MAEEVIIKVSGESSGMQSVVTAGKHTITIDEPEHMGGDDTGADPLSTMLAALAGCENVVAQLVANEINFDLQGLTFEIEGKLDPRGFMGDPSVTPYFSKVEITARVVTSEDDARIQELKEKTDKRCPVFTTLKAAGIEMITTWSKA